MVPLLTAAVLERRQVAALADIATRHAANQLARFGWVQVIGITPREIRLALRDHRRERRYPTFFVTQDGQVEWTCTCNVVTAFKPCPCVVAANNAALEYLRAHPPQTWETQLDRLLESVGGTSRRVRSPLLLVFSLQHNSWGWQVNPITVPLNDLPENIDVADRTTLAATLQALPKQPSTPPKEFDADRYPYNTPQTIEAARWIQAQSGFYGYYGRNDFGPIWLDQVLRRLTDAPLFLASNHSAFQHPLTISTEPMALTLHADELPTSDLELSVRLRDPEGALTVPQQVQVVCRQPTWLLIEERRLVPVTTTPHVMLLSLIEAPIVVPAAEKSVFYESHLLRLANHVPMTGTLAIQETLTGLTPEPRIYLSEQQRQLVIGLRFGYGTLELPADQHQQGSGVAMDPTTGTLVQIQRDTATEAHFEARLAAEGRLKRGGGIGEFLLRTNASMLDFVLESIPKLTAEGFVIFGEESLTQARINRARPTLSWNVSSGIDWFDVDAVVTFGETTASLKELRRAIRNRDRFVRLADGSLGVIPPEWIANLRLTLGLGEETREGIRLSPLHAALLEETIRTMDGDLKADAEFARRRDALRAFESITPQPLPEGFVGNLRPYQKAGFDWLCFLRHYGFGGCLADDMGTGKTIQALVLLLSMRGRTPRPNLLIVPRSLLVNWEREAARFAPSLRFLRHEGNLRNRTGVAFDDYDVVLTTYGILLRDIEKLRQQRFQYVLLDEAQAIKNPLSQTSRAVRLLRAEHRLTLTGTPVENEIAELWSQFAFLNPGLLGSLEQFRENFSGDTNAHSSLRQLTRPFLLRRTKALVAPELPPRTEHLQLCEFESAQRKLYDQTRDRYRAQILGLLDDGPAKGSTQLTILEGLLRLRQICCDPRLVEPGTRVVSAKLIAVLEMLETLQAEGSKTLIFSQFVQLLSLLRHELDAKGLPYLYLDGRTRDRQARVDAFQDDPSKTFFLISLKAGGTGLNLTAADHVIHLDPWWNPAVEQQATDRAHRIGQDKPVFVTRFVVKDTVEEKILTLQERKRELVQKLIADETSFFKSLTRTDIEALFT